MINLKRYLSGSRFFQLIVTIILSIFLCVVLYPLIYVVSASFSEPSAVKAGELVLLPVGFNTEGYQYVFANHEIWLGYGNTILYTVLGTVVNLAVTLPCAYALSRNELVGRNKLMVYFMITMYIGGGLIPSYLNVKSLGLLNTRSIIFTINALSVYNMIVARTFFASTIPYEITEAARIDGCNDFGIFSKIVMPLSKALMAVMVLYYGVGHWNSYFTAMIYLDDREKYPLQLFLREILIQSNLLATIIGNDSSMSAEEMAVLMKTAENAELVKYCIIVVAALPMMIIYPRLQKFFEKGVMIGSVKG